MKKPKVDERAAWLEARKAGVGSSEAAAILGVHPFLTALDVFNLKTGRAEETDHEEMSEAMEAGTRLEGAVAEWFADRSGLLVVDPGPFQLVKSKRGPFVATPDRYIVDPANPAKGRGILEVKTTHAMKAKEWRDEPPLWSQVQLQHQFGVVEDVTWGIVCVLIGGQALRYSSAIDRNPKFVAALQEQEPVFWAHVAKDDPPPYDPLRDAEALQRLYPADDGSLVRLPSSLRAVDDEIESLKGERARIAREIEIRENRIRAALREAAAGVLPGGIVWSWKTQERAEHVVKASSFRTLRRRQPKAN